MICFNSKITQKVLSYFYLNPESEMYVNEIARKFGIDRGNLVKKLKELENDNVLQKRKRGNLSLYKINKKNPFYKEYKKIIQKSFGIEPELIELLKNVKGLKKAIVFGSYAKNQLSSQSDIDLLLVGSHSCLEIQKQISKLQSKYDREINTVDLTESEFRKKKDNSFIKNIFQNKYIQII